jgi:hypothetical protein
MGGTCVRNGTRFACKCPPNRTGDQCEKNDPCQANPCIGYDLFLSFQIKYSFFLL